MSKTLIIATSKPEEFTLKILEHFDLLKYFDFVAGATMDGSRGEKADVIRYVDIGYPEGVDEMDVNTVRAQIKQKQLQHFLRQKKIYQIIQI